MTNSDELAGWDGVSGKFVFPVVEAVTSVGFMRAVVRALLLGLSLLWQGGDAWAQLSSMDSGASAQKIAKWDEGLLTEWGQAGPWLRIRGIPDPSVPTKSELVRQEVAALRALKGLGFKSIPFLRWGTDLWKTGVRTGGGQRLPLDLREVYARVLAYGQAYGEMVAGFELENEPDISFVQDNPETYMAFLKAGYLGLKQGAAENVGPDDKQSAGSIFDAQPNDRLDWPAGTSLVYRRYAGRRGGAWEPLNWRDVASAQLPVRGPLVVMAPLALPPGPYFEQLVANGLFSYTDAFNYHYYGYADDFSGVYRQFEAAVHEAGQRPRGQSFFFTRAEGNPAWRAKRLPVLLTEYGYGSLSGADSDTVEGRVRQWQWFRSVGGQISKLRITGPMAFYLPPYFENKSIEFGLTVPHRDRAQRLDPELEAPTSTATSQLAAYEAGISKSRFTAGGLAFTAGDFGQSEPAQWMDRIGQRIGENDTTPALAWLLTEGMRKTYRPKLWTVHVPEASPVVIDFIAEEGLVQQKRYSGYVAFMDFKGRSKADGSDPALESDPAKSGRGSLVLYNLSAQTVQGRLEVVRGRELLADHAVVEHVWTLAPMARILVPLTLVVPAREFAGHELALRFSSATTSPSSSAGPTGAQQPGLDKAQPQPVTSAFSTFFYPEASAMEAIPLYDFHALGRALGQVRAGAPVRLSESYQNQALLARRRLAVEEPRLQPAGAWRVTQGVGVEESSEQTWRFTITDFPAEPNKPAMAELPLPDDFVFPDHAMMKFDYRLVQPAGTTLADGKYFEAYFRTANGNLYQVWPRQYAMAAWHGYTEIKENYTMAFYGRSNLPWRFRDNRPVALVFFFRPGRAALPAIYEVKGARIVGLQLKSD